MKKSKIKERLEVLEKIAKLQEKINELQDEIIRLKRKLERDPVIYEYPTIDPPWRKTWHNAANYLFTYIKY